MDSTTLLITGVTGTCAGSVGWPALFFDQAADDKALKAACFSASRSRSPAATAVMMRLAITMLSSLPGGTRPALPSIAALAIPIGRCCHTTVRLQDPGGDTVSLTQQSKQKMLSSAYW